MENPALAGTDENPWRDVPYVARRLGCEESYVRQLCRLKEIRFRKIGRVYRFLDDWVNEYIARTTVLPRAATRTVEFNAGRPAATKREL
jgi:excisionase family DNA binding protein